MTRDHEPSIPRMGFQPHPQAILRYDTNGPIRGVNMAPKTLPQVFARMGLLPLTGLLVLHQARILGAGSQVGSDAVLMGSSPASAPWA